jgi:hypothetical protein
MMPTVHTHYVTYVRGHRRRHAGAVAADIITPLSSTVTDPGTYQALASPFLPWTDGNGQQENVSFAFWSVTGAADGPAVSTNESLAVNDGANDVVATAWYIPPGSGGGGNGGPGIIIDAFDVNQGTFVDDDFVTVSPDASLTFAANDDGWVPTTNAEDVNAFSAIHAVPFLDWTVFAGTEAVVNGDLKAAVTTSAVAFAFYQSPQSPGPHRFNPAAEGTWVSYGVMVDGGGPTGNGPVPPWNPYLRELAAGLALAEAGQLVRPQLRGAVLRIAATQVKAAAASMAEQMQKAGQ